MSIFFCTFKMTNKYSFRVFGTFTADNYSSAQLTLLSALDKMTNSKVQSVELSEWEQQEEVQQEDVKSEDVKSEDIEQKDGSQL